MKWVKFVEALFVAIVAGLLGAPGWVCFVLIPVIDSLGRIQYSVEILASRRDRV